MAAGLSRRRTSRSKSGMRRVRNTGLRAGKTGTAWKYDEDINSYSSTERIGSFVGLLPADDPELAIVVTVDTPTIGLSYGGVVAGPAFSSIASQSMRHLGIPANPDLLRDDDEAEEDALALTEAPEVILPEPPEAPVEVTWTPEGSLRAPDLTGMSLRDALATLQGTGLSISMQGSGRITGQAPAPGTPLTLGDALEVTLQ